MKSGYRAILYIVIILLIAGGLTLFFLRDQVTTFLAEQAGVAKVGVPAKVNVAANPNALDIEIFKTAKFTALKNNVVNFDFDSICKTPVGTIETTATTTDGEVATSTTTLSCRLGNNIPFPLPLKTQP